MRVYNLYRCDADKSSVSMKKIKATTSLDLLRDAIRRQIVDGWMQFHLYPNNGHPKEQARAFVKCWNDFARSKEHQLSEVWDNLEFGCVEVI